jgi:hypothetical protein
MENLKHDHPHNHNHKHDAAAAAGHHEHKLPDADDAVDLENLKTAAQPHKGTDHKAEAKDAAHKAVQHDTGAGTKADAKAIETEALAQKLKQEIEEIGRAHV